MTIENTKDLNGKFYLVAPNLLGPGSTILPGNFGKNLKSHPAGSPEKGMLARELMFENIRLSSYHQLPSRLNCVFLFLDQDTAIQQMDTIGGLAPCVYEVSLKNPAAKTVVCDMTHINNVGRLEPETSFFHTVSSIANDYWKQVPYSQDPVFELLTESPVIINRLLGHGQN